MKVLFVVDNISDITSKIDKIKNRFGNDIVFIVKAPLEPIFKTFGYTIHAIYYNNLARVMHQYLSNLEVQDVVIYYSSLNLTDSLLNTFVQKIGNRDKVVNIMPEYNFFERIENNLYNVYVKSMFKMKDSLASPKLQFLPTGFMQELLASHFGNKLFAVNEKFVKNIDIDDKELCKNLKVKPKFNPFNLLSIIIALIITIGLIVTLAFVKVNYLVVILFVCLYVLDLVISLIVNYKMKFDARFLK